MRYISLFSGIEAATVAWEPLGFEPVAFSEIDKFPSAVLAYRFPDVPNLGDITKVDWNEFNERYGSVDVIVGGSPCQSFSIAGRRESLSGESALCFEYYRAVRDVRPRWFLWENVPGVLSTRDNAFGQFISKLEKLGYGLAWRVLDAQFFGVAQRRRRVFLVGCLGNGGASAAVLFERESVSGNTQSSKEKRKELAEAAGRGSGACGFKFHQGAAAGGIGATDEQSLTLTADWRNPAVMALQSDGSTSINSNGGGIATMTARTPSTQSTDSPSRSRRTSAARSDWRDFDGSRTGALAANPDFNKGQGASLIVDVCIASGQANAEIAQDGTAPTVTTLHEAPIVIDRAAYSQGRNAKYPPMWREPR